MNRETSRCPLLPSSLLGGALLLGLTNGCGSGTVAVVSLVGDEISGITGGDTFINCDCNHNGIGDQDDLGSGFSVDCNGNGVPDECDVLLVEVDRNGNGIPDSCEIISGATSDCNGNGIPDDLDLEQDLDCNDNGILDACDILSLESEDCNTNGVPDECDYDRDQNGVPDDCQVLATNPGAPGSLLVFPEWDNHVVPDVRDFTSLLTVTNISAEQVLVQLIFYDPATCAPWQGTASTAARTITLEPFDTYTVSISDFPFADHEGYALAYAVDELGQPIARNDLIGSVLVSETQRDNLVRGMDAIAFQAVGLPGELTDVDVDGVLDLDGVEYSAAPDRILFPRFLGQDADTFVSRLIILQLSEAGQSELTVDLEIRNDRGIAAVAQYTITPELCWSRRFLDEVSLQFEEIILDIGPNDPLEIDGWTAQEAGWFSISGRSTASGNTPNPAMLAVLLASDAGSSFLGQGVAVRPVFSGTRTSGGFDVGLPGGAQ